ncbi:MAG: hypothetical protein ACI4IL_03070 [Eubacterium sp.]
MQKNVDERRKKNNKAKKKHSFLRSFLIFISMLVLAIAVFIGTVKLISPEFDFSFLIPKQITTFVSGISGDKKQHTQASAAITTTTTTTQRYKDYLEHEDFAIEATKKGAVIGNLLNGGKVDKDGNYIYHIVDGKGIYRFYTYNESFVRIYKTDEILSSLNIIGENLYFVNESKQTLCRFNKKTAVVDTLADGIKSVYAYDDRAYCVNNSNQVVAVNINSLNQTVLYTASAEEEVNIVGIAKNEVFFTSKGDFYTKYLVSDKLGRENVLEFKEMTLNSDIMSLSMEDGFMYYYQKQSDDSYNLVRQKFGSDKIITLVEDVTCFNPVIVDKNRVFYSHYHDSKYILKELNMNTMTKKTMLSVNKAKDDHSLIIQHGGEYDFIIGKKSEKGSKVYNASSNLTSSKNVMRFSDGAWSY